MSILVLLNIQRNLLKSLLEVFGVPFGTFSAYQKVSSVNFPVQNLKSPKKKTVAMQVALQHEDV